MSRYGFVVAMLSLCIADRSLLPYVNNYIGTGGHGFGIGSTPVGVQGCASFVEIAHFLVPFGSLRLGPDTSGLFDSKAIRWDHFSGYYYGTNSYGLLTGKGDEYIQAFSHTRLVGAGVNDYGNVGIMPTLSISPQVINKDGYRSKFSHSHEHVSPGARLMNFRLLNCSFLHR